MALTIGARLGPYEVTARIGAGGMGEVYRATDINLKRAVAIKVLPEAFAQDAERLARFQREAEVLATLNHANIAAIYGFERVSGTTALVMELVEGPTLADRIASTGALPIEEALAIVKQIAEALEAAHERGIVHRDLKPANIKVRSDGTVKVLDFGLAKAIEPVSQVSTRHGLTQSPTITTPAMTMAGVILGTAAYMSPEQARGLAADQRSDVFSFGCVLYEMLCGRQAFSGDTVADVLASVLAREPDLNALPRDLHPQLRSLIERCLDKNPKRRWHAVADLRFEIEAAAATPRVAFSALGQPRSRKGVAALMLLAVAATALLTSLAWWSQIPRVAPLVVTRFTITVAERQAFLSQYQAVAISPDGALLAYNAAFRLHTRAMGDLEGKIVPGTEDVALAYPTFAPDGKSLAVFAAADRAIERIAVEGGTRVTICRVDSEPSGITWGPSGILFGAEKGIMRVSPDGGAPELIAAVGADEFPYGPQWLPGDNAVLFTVATGTDIDRWDRARIVVLSLASGQTKTLFEGGSDARYLPSGHIIYAVGGTIFARRFDAQRLEVSGEPVAVISGVRRSGASRALGGVGVGLATTQLSVSSNGALAYVPGSSERMQLLLGKLVFVDRNGMRQPLKLAAGPYQHPRVSPDGKQVVYGTDDGKSARIWVYDLSEETNARPLTFEGNARFPIWSADGQWIVFQSDHDGDPGLFRRRADGTSGQSERLTTATTGESHSPDAWQPKGDALLYTSTNDQIASLWTLSLPDRKAMRFQGLDKLSVWPDAAFSPDGRWVAYTTGLATQKSLVTMFVEPFPPTGEKHQVATTTVPGSSSAHFPVWSRDSKALFYVNGTIQTGIGLAQVTVNTTPRIAFGNPVSLERGFRVVGPGIGRARTFDVMPDGRFIGLVESDEIDNGGGGTQQINLVLNWTEELKQRVPTR